MIGPLDGIRVIELARYQAGPRCGMILSDLGADVIKIENIGGEESRRSAPLVNGQSIYFGAYNRGKRSLCLDLRKPAGKEVFFDLLQTADIVLENFRPGTLEKMGLGYEELVKVKPDVILARVSGFGQAGANSDRPAFDSLGQAMSGLMSLTGGPDATPVGTAFSIVDRTTALHATVGTLAALRHRDRTGEGQVLDVCMMDAALTMVEIPVSYYLSTGLEGGESGRPPYQAKDGWVVIQVGPTSKFIGRLAELIGADAQPESGKAANNSGSFFGPLRPGLIAWCKERTVEQICMQFRALGIPVAPVLSIPQVAQDPYLSSRNMMVKTPDALAGEIHLPGQSVKLGKSPGRTGPIAAAGEHTRAILSELLRYDADRIETLHQLNIVQ